MAYVVADIPYFSCDSKFQHEKPYIISFPVDDIEGAQVSNHVGESSSVTIRNMRHFPEPPSIEIQGFTYLKVPTSLEYPDFSSRDKIRTTYFAELQAALHQTFSQYKAFAFFDYEVRRRSEMYPSQKGVSVPDAQPLAQAHVDYSLEGAIQRLRRELSNSQSKNILDGSWDMLNIWRPIKDETTPDWPLAFCDFQSLDVENDIRQNDIVYENHVGEDEVLMSNPSHQWFYLKDQCKDEILVWRNINVPTGDQPRAFHTAFNNPLANSDCPRRESIEVRVAAFK